MPTYYDVDLRHAKLREFAFSTPLLLMPLVALLKLCRFRFPGTTDDPPVEKLAPFEVDQSELPYDIRAKFAPLARDLAALGFGRPIYHSIPYSLHATRSYWATCVHPDGQTWARIHCRIWSGEGKDKVNLFPIFFTEFQDGSFLITSAGKQDMIMPEGTRLVTQTLASTPALWKRHLVELERDLRLTPRPVASPQEVRPAMERLHALIRDYLLDRGIFQPLSDAEQERLQSAVTRSKSAGDGITTAESLRRSSREVEPVTRPTDPEEAAVMLELDRLQNTKASWMSMLLVLIVSALLFVGAGNMGQGQEMLWTIIPILFFHEMGHYIAMRWFGYRNLKMFFIPFFGAAVSGQHYNVPGWKKVIVALAGPVPGIIVGGLLGRVALALDQHWLVHAAMFTVILNGFNLLPLLPLDGGWVLHAILFSRHPVLDVVFRFVAIVGLFALGLWAQEWVLYVLPGVMLISLPVSWRLANVSHELRKEGAWDVPSDTQTIPFEAAHRIYLALRTALPTMKMPRVMAQHLAQVFETVNARPPGIGASIALLAAHGVSFAAALFLAVVLMMGGNWWMWGGGMRPIPPQKAPAHEYEPGQTDVWRGPEAPTVLTESNSTLVATCRDSATAKKAWEDLKSEVPKNATLRWFGHDVILVLPKDNKQERDAWHERLKALDRKADARGAQAMFALRVWVDVPEGDAGDKLAAELKGYLEAPNTESLIPPWSPEWAKLPPDQLQQFQKARRTYGRLNEARREAARMHQLEAPGVFRLGKQNDLIERFQKAGEAAKAEERKRIDQLRAEGGDDVDQTILTFWDALDDLRTKANLQPKDWQVFQKQQTDIFGRLAEHMGRLPMDGNRPKAGSNLVSCRYGGVSRNGRTLDLTVAFGFVHEGLPTFAEWLAQRGGSRMRYEFPKAFGVDDADDDP